MGQLAISYVDLCIVIFYMIATVTLGLWIRDRKETVQNYFLADRSLPWWTLLLSIVATETSTVTFLSVPGVSYASEGGDFRFLQAAIGFVAGRIIVAFLILPGYFRGSYLTSYELLQNSHGPNIRKLCSLLFLVTRTLADALRLYLTAIVLREVAQLDLSICIVLIGVATIGYTIWGGMKSVVWNDCIQFFVYMTGAAAAFFVLLTLLPGGWADVVEFGSRNNKFTVFDFNPDPRSDTFTFWIGLLGGAFLSMATHGTDQLTVQRLLSSESRNRASMILIASGIVVFFQFALFLLIGVGLACFYETHEATREFSSNDQVFATFIVQQLPVGVVGLILAAVFSAAMSTLSSSLNASASAVVNDFLVSSESAKESKKLLQFAKASTLVFGLAQIGIALVAESIIGDRSAVYKVLNIAGFASGPILGLFLLAVLFPAVDSGSTFVGFFSSIALLCIVAWGIPEPFRVNGFYFCLIGSVGAFVFARITHWLRRGSG